MGEKYKLQSLGSDDKVRSVAFTNESEITIGSGLDADVRLQHPSVEESHVLVYFDHMKIRVFGNNVFLNDEALEKESVYAFRFGDVLKINRYRFVFSLTEPGDFVDEDKIIRKPTMELSYLNRGGEGGEKRSCSGSPKKIRVERDMEGKDDVTGDAVVSIALNKVGGVSVSLCKGEEIEDVSSVKQVLEEQKEVLKREIKESIEQCVVDTPVLPSIGKKNPRDLGEVMIEKEILDSAERMVEEKIRNEYVEISEGLDELKQNVKDNIKEELREDLKKDFMEDVKEDIRDEVKEVLSSSDMKNAIATDVIGRIEAGKEEGDEAGKEKPDEKSGGRRRRSSAMRLLPQEDAAATPRKASIRGKKRASEASEGTSKKRKGAKKAEEKAKDGSPQSGKTKRKEGKSEE
ncbi:hypothetical protein [Encephalitozoon cuniculi GB-M1]|uniref:Uncharacterized protein n=1 Tax=Encephalitozoon cuniculi (strain GB-M1) TaxID=284813 RepID=Q8SVA8_ENCCU|nr:uncharacterized protein ECU06_0860 [Encephalitozoon cuniculi GB-M1]KMV65980.1 hypothetical protein M970_060790 [Encephalitozoon cuniculi EcunIII-L]UYI27677.1 hypothetical protein J0A71_07g15560 [Encephalitozoon cuniculi]CAD25446.1 hypothetical protein [Encephalitozoon cuniculi GB-M1]